MVNSYGQARTVSEPNHTILGQAKTGLQIRRSNKDNLGIIIHMSSEKHIL